MLRVVVRLQQAGQRRGSTMPFSWRLVCRLVVAGLLPVAPSLMAGVLIVESQQAIFSGGAEKTLRIQVDRDRVSVDVTRDEERTTYIYRGDLGTFWIIDHAEKVYREIAREVIETFQDYRGEAKAAMAVRVNEQLQNLPPAQRREIETNMRDRLSEKEEAPPESAKIRFKKVTEAGTAGGWTCDWYEGVQGEQKVWEVCAVNWALAEVSPEDIGSLERMAGLLSKFSPADAENFLHPGGADGKKSPGYPGIAVSRISYQEGLMRAFYEVSEFEQQEFSAEVFEAPAGFQRRALVLLEGAPR